MRYPDRIAMKSSFRLQLSIAIAVGVWFWTVAPAGATVFLTTAEALALAFPDCAVERETRYLTEAEQAEVGRRAGQALESRLAHPYRASCKGEPGGTAYFDTHRVRTLPETVMIVVTPDGKVGRIEVLSFQEPREYKAPDPYLAQFAGKSLADPLAIKRDLRGLTGATLTARATTEAVRRVLALHAVLFPDASPRPKPVTDTP